jgi:hypothetical protein
MASEHSLETKFRVHTAIMTKAPAKVTIEGEEVDADISQFEVELLSEEGHGSLALRFRGAKADAARAQFKPGQPVIATWEE